MPELPEVQTTVNGLNKFVKGLIIQDVWSSYNSAYHSGKDNIKDPAYFKIFKKNIVGKKITLAKRRAKNIIIELSNGAAILIHMKMTGHLMYGTYIRNSKHEIRNPKEKQNTKDEWVPKEKDTPLSDPFNRHIRFAVTFTNGKQLVLSDMRKFAKVTYIPNIKEESEHLKGIGPEPLENKFDAKQLQERLSRRPNGKIKTVLMDPTIVAGIGNIYSDEILWHANIHPERKVKDIQSKEFILIYKAMKETLQKGIDFGGDSMSDYRNILGERGKFQEKHNAYRKTGTKCSKPGCEGIIQRKVIGGRSAHFCDTHQK